MDFPKQELPRLARCGNTQQLIVNGKPFVMLAGEIHNSSSSDLGYMDDHVWPRLVALNCNTAIVPVYWELVEPVEGQFDLGLIDGLLQGARKHGLKLVLLWFGTWKNALSSYAPAWVKTDLGRFPRAQCTVGKNTMAISAFSREAAAADARAFAAVMKHLREVDASEQTVLMVQVENETGLLGATRDHCAAAERAFAQQVPVELMKYLAAHRATLRPELAQMWGEGNNRADGTWAQVFGTGADEVFMAWHVAGFVQQVAVAGVAQYALPMFANAWLIWNQTDAPGVYPSGGPVTKMADIWRAAAPDIAVPAPDIYLPDFRGVCEDYIRSGIPLIIPEAPRDLRACANAWYAIGHSAICYGPFGIESIPEADQLGEVYAIMREMMPIITAHAGDGTMVGLVQQGAQKEQVTVTLGDYRILVEFNAALTPVTLAQAFGPGPSVVPGSGLIVALSPREFLVAGNSFSLEFLPKEGGLPNTEFMTLDEGVIRDGQWIPGRRLNGDESGHGRWLNMPAKPGLRRVVIHSYE